MGGRVNADNLVHREALMARELQARNPSTMNVEMFANHDGDHALRALLRLLDEDGDGQLSVQEKQHARIVIFGHSWGASEAVNLANRLDRLSIPVLLTVQVDSVQKQKENDRRIPANVLEAVNFYQSEGMLHGRAKIQAADPAKTHVLGNYESNYREHPVALDGYPWFARAFMRPHIEIENDPQLWKTIEELIVTQLAEPLPATRPKPGN